MEPIAVVTVLALIEYFVFGLLVARARARTGIKAPSITGNPEFERHFRVQQNTLEQLMIFLPALWLFGYYVNALAGSALGLLFIVGRYDYYRGYVADAVKRGRGFSIGAFSTAILLVGALIGAIVSWL